MALEIDDLTDFRQVEPERSRLSDKPKHLDVLVLVEPITGVRSGSGV
jgi:hypothetical protein